MIKKKLPLDGLVFDIELLEQYLVLPFLIVLASSFSNSLLSSGRRVFDVVSPISFHEVSC